MLTLATINHFKVLLCVLLYAALLQKWFSPACLGRQWQATLSDPERNLRVNLPVRTKWFVSFGSGLWKIYFLLVWLLATQPLSAWTGAGKGALLAAALSLLPVLQAFNLPGAAATYFRRLMIEGAGDMLALTLCGLILGAWL